MNRYVPLTSDKGTPDTYYSLGSPGTIEEVVTVGAYISKDTLKSFHNGN